MPQYSHPFYRAMRVRSADSTASICLSVCLSHAGIVSNRIIRLFHRPVASHTILCFTYQTLWPYSDGDPP